MNDKNPTINYTIAQLIAALKQFPPDLPVLTNGYEEGFENITTPQKISVEYQPNTEHWSGEFNTPKQGKGSLEAVVLHRNFRSV